MYTDSYKITLDYGKHGSEDVDAYAGEVLDLDIPVFDGYIFMGWYDDATFTKLHDFSTAIDKDITLYAKFANYHTDIKEINDSIDECGENAMFNMEKIYDEYGKIETINFYLISQASAA